MPTTNTWLFTLALGLSSEVSVYHFYIAFLIIFCHLNSLEKRPPRWKSIRLNVTSLYITSLIHYIITILDPYIKTSLSTI